MILIEDGHTYERSELMRALAVVPGRRCVVTMVCVAPDKDLSSRLSRDGDDDTTRVCVAPDKEFSSRLSHNDPCCAEGTASCLETNDDAPRSGRGARGAQPALAPAE